jgi:hypothetical protein
MTSLRRPTEPVQTLLDHARTYAARGWSTIPVIGKQAAGLWKPFQRRPADEEALGRLFTRKGVTGLAVVLGSVSGGLVCRDYDLRSAYRAWARRRPDLARCLPTVETHRGFHVYFIGPEGFVDLGDAGEYRGDPGHYTILPPSSHPNGTTYRWLVALPDGPLPEIPDPATAGLLPRGTRLNPCPAADAFARAAEEGEGKTQQPRQPIACVTCPAVDAIRDTLPDGPGQRNRKVFDLARRLRAIAGLDTSPAALQAIVTEWHRRALPVITTKPFAETWTDFQTAWLRVKTPHGATVRRAYEAARRAPQAPLDGNPDLGVLAAMCEALGAAGGPFYLSCRTVAGLFGVTHMTGWRWFRVLQFHGVLELVSKGTLRGHQATTWRYTGV